MNASFCLAPGAGIEPTMTTDSKSALLPPMDNREYKLVSIELTFLANLLCRYILLRRQDLILVGNEPTSFDYLLCRCVLLRRQFKRVALLG
jgi:hypothetical protein